MNMHDQTKIMTTPDEEEQHMSHELSDRGSNSFARAMQIKLERF